jgi:hypothetical protein
LGFIERFETDFAIGERDADVRRNLDAYFAFRTFDGDDVILDFRGNATRKSDGF